jgi:hypothetical protein
MNILVKEGCLEKIMELLNLRGKEKVSVEYALESVDFYERVCFDVTSCDLYLDL